MLTDSLANSIIKNNMSPVNTSLNLTTKDTLDIEYAEAVLKSSAQNQTFQLHLLLWSVISNCKTET